MTVKNQVLKKRRMTMVKVYFETPNGSYSELVAIFDSENTYMICLMALKIKAKEMNMIVTESIQDTSSINDLDI